MSFVSTLQENVNLIQNTLEGHKGLSNDLRSFMGIEFEDEDSKGLVEIKLDIVGDENLVFENDVTDNYVENNVAYQDHISVKPFTYTVRGTVGDLVYYKNNNKESFLEAVPEKLTAVASFIPSTTKKVNSIRNKAIKISNFVNSIDNFAKRFSKLSEGSLQKQAVEYLILLREQRKPIKIRCAWCNLENVVITRLEVSQDKESVDKTDITISFKQIRVTGLGSAQFNVNDWMGIDKQQRSPIKEAGQTSGVKKVLTIKKFLE